MRKIAVIILALGMLAFITSCTIKNAAANDEIGGKTFVWEKEGFGGDFTITLDKDGTYQYYAGALSSYIGFGDWTEEDGILTLTEKSGYDNIFHFAVKNGELVFISEGSSQFMYVTVENGDRFLPENTK